VAGVSPKIDEGKGVIKGNIQPFPPFTVEVYPSGLPANIEPCSMPECMATKVVASYTMMEMLVVTKVNI
jgi:hypothetical protein